MRFYPTRHKRIGPVRLPHQETALLTAALTALWLFWTLFL